ncbi:MAG: hypothetical protein JWR80_9554 [Bradyrhizobium sp.]|nr:hypothetical protein [Bradyrhizobium sp.]
MSRNPTLEQPKAPFIERGGSEFAFPGSVSSAEGQVIGARVTNVPMRGTSQTG